MDNDGKVMRHEMECTLAGLTEKLSDLEHQISGPVRTVRESVNTVRKSIDLKLQVRQRPWTMIAAATALGLVGGVYSSRGNSHRVLRAKRVPEQTLQTVSYDPITNAALTRPAIVRVPSWIEELSEKFQPELAALKGIAVGALIEIVREMVTKPPQDRPRENPTNGSNGKCVRPNRAGVSS